MINCGSNGGKMSEHLFETDTDSQRMTHLHLHLPLYNVGREGNEFLNLLKVNI